MSDNFQFDDFLSHSSTDKDVVRAVAEQLRADGLEVWFDEWVLTPGDSAPAKIEEGRLRALCMSANLFDSDWSYLACPAVAPARRGKSGAFEFREPLNKKRRFVSLRFDDSCINGSLTQFIYVNWSRRQASKNRPTRSVFPGYPE